MAVFYNAGEQKIRPGVYQRHVNLGNVVASGAQDGICAIPIRANWGPLGKVVRVTNPLQLTEIYGSGTYAGATYTVPAAAAMFAGGASTVLTYRLGSADNAQAATKSITFTPATPEQGEDPVANLNGGTVVFTAKYSGTMPISISVTRKTNAIKQLTVYANNAQVELFEFAANAPSGTSEGDPETVTTQEGPNLVAATAASNYVTITATPTSPATVGPTVVPVTPVASGHLTGGANPTSIAITDYQNAFEAFERYYYNTIALDIPDDGTVIAAENNGYMPVSQALQAYLDDAYLYGKLGIAVVGEATTVTFETRMAHAQAFNDAKVVYLGGGWMNGTDSYDGALGICYTAGVIASTPSNAGITHDVINGATDLCEALTFSQYEDAILSGMLMVSMSPDGSIWYDSGINTLTNPDDATQDAGWKKIRRVKVRFEVIDRLDRALAPKVGQISADTDGISDVIQSGQRVLDLMANNEGKLQPGASFIEDPDNPFTTDSAWFIIQAVDIDSLEKIYLQYQFRYSQNA